MKVKLLCKYGDKSPGDVVEVKADVAKTLIAAGNAVEEKKADVTKDSKEVVGLKARVTALEGEVTTLKTEKTALEGEVTTLKTDAPK